LTPTMVDLIRQEWNREIRAPEAFWRARARGRATSATLIWLGNVCPLRPFRIEKRNRRAWMVLAGPPIPGRPVVAGRETAAAGLQGSEA